MRPFSVVLDPGHGGPFARGAMWPPFGGAKGLVGDELARAIAAHAATAAAVEADINDQIAESLACVIDATEWPVAIYRTRYGDEALALDTRAAIARKHDADLVLVIHCDSCANAIVAGFGTYVRPDDAVGMAVARDIMTAAPRPLRRASLEPKVAQPRPHWSGAAYAVMAQHTAPAVLVECGFLSNDSDRKVLTTDSGRALIVSALMAGIAGFWHRRA